MKKRLPAIIICILVAMTGILSSACAEDKIPAGRDVIGIIGAMEAPMKKPGAAGIHDVFTALLVG